MASFRDRQNSFASLKQLPHWTQMEQRGRGSPSDPNRPPVVHAEPPRPIEPGDSRDPSGPYLYSRPREDSHVQQRQLLPGVKELLSPSVRIGAQSPVSGNWAPINNPPSWCDRTLHSARGSIHLHNAPLPAPEATQSVNHLHYQSQIEGSQPDTYSHINGQTPMGLAKQPPVSMSVMPLRQPEILSPTNHGRLEYLARSGEYLPSLSYNTITNPSHHDAPSEQQPDRRSSSVMMGRSGPGGSLFGLQIVGQRDIPGEGLCYVFKDGSTCPTVIDGEPVNPLWGTTKAGKARKRLAQACLNCREKKIKCEPGETSCLQCEKAKRECQRPSAAQSQAEMATGAALAMSHGSPERGDWKSQASPTDTSMIDMPAPKRRRSAHVAQQESAYVRTHSRASSPSNGSKRRKSDISSSASARPTLERLRKDSKRPLTDDDESLATSVHVEEPDVMAMCEDPYQIEPEGTLLFLDQFFAQSAREVHMLFPRHAFTRWVTSCDSKCQRECMVLYAVLALGSTFSTNEFSSFAKVCVERATRAATNLYGRFSVALVQTRLLLGTYFHLKGKDGLAWDYSGSALRGVGALRLNREEGCGEDLDEYSRRYYSFTREQLRECRRRTFWAAFLVDRYNGFCSGLLTTIHEDDVHIRLPCNSQLYEDGCASTAPYFESSGAVSGDVQSPAAYTVAVSVLWKEVVQFMYRSEHYPASSYAARYESFLGNIQRRLSDWNQRLPQHLKYSREALERAIHYGYAGDFVSMHSLHLMSHMRAARMVRHELLMPSLVARSICTAHSHALQLLALVRDMRTLTLSSSNTNFRTTDFMSPFIAYAVTSAIDTLGAGGLQEEIVATKQVLSTAIEVLRELSQYCMSARVQLRKAEKRLDQIKSWPPESDIRAGRGAGSRCWRITEPMEKPLSLQQDVMYGVSSSTFSEALTEGRKR